MKRVLIVDDEILYRRFIRKLIDWKAYGCYEPREAENGLQALQMIEEELADIVITDMIMSSMNGLDLMATIRERWPEIQLIALSGYGEYSLVRGAFRLSVDDYLLKTEITSEGLLNALRGLVQRQVARALEEGSAGWLDKDIAGLYSAMYEIKGKNTIMLAICSQDFFPIQHQDIERIELAHDVQIFLACDERLLLDVASQAAKKRQAAVLYSPAEPLMMTIANAYERLGTEIWMDRGRIRRGDNDGLKHLTPSVSDRMKLMDQWFHNPRLIDESIYYDILVDEREVDAIDPREVGELYGALNSYLKSPDMVMISNSAAEGFQKEFDGERRLAQLNSFIQELFRSMRGDGNINYYLVRETNNYIRTGYAHNITLGELAQSLLLSEEHVSRSVVMSTGKTFSQLLLECRMENAQKLIETSGMRIYEIAEAVGYQNYESFSRAFKRFFRISPAVYMRNCRIKGGKVK